MVVLAVGLVLNTKVQLGVSPAISLAVAVSELSGMSLGDTTFLWYCLFIGSQMAIHTLRNRTDGKVLQVYLLKDALQLVVSLIFTRAMNAIAAWLPSFEQGIILRLTLLLIAIVLTGIGAAMTLRSGYAPNPVDGIVQTIAEACGLPTGTVKNLFDFACVLLTVTISYVGYGRILGIGIGTVAAMLGTGRVIAMYNRCIDKIQKLKM